ncbi:hypothetical protein E2C01_060124 [Portunus trituberculatus]|uniref:Uncharacterized protein n=1 Tax=Portunus trituberculatus TaxID=210409 RepID=A0A5B7H058_PORTR|nr:hypothetical protein [Portunus trituberculatus]
MPSPTLANRTQTPVLAASRAQEPADQAHDVCADTLGHVVGLRKEVVNGTSITSSVNEVTLADS